MAVFSMLPSCLGKTCSLKFLAKPTKYISSFDCLQLQREMRYEGDNPFACKRMNYHVYSRSEEARRGQGYFWAFFFFINEISVMPRQIQVVVNQKGRDDYILSEIDDA
ncbi:hypothetical protein HAX54_032913 [Datura stramonium]|uniref:Uncharacterized protein n=1 Tax=Datura stramonium TaxID=4076 RepID=A0ABS8SCZ9_DATST|nr:hypothetical protein [Datura stramonium]